MSPRLATSGLEAVPGFRAAGVACGIKKDRPDLMLLVSDRSGTTAAAVFTQNVFAAAPVHVSRQHVADGDVRAIVANAGNANACTGRQGLRDALRMARETAEALGLRADQVLVASTGIIGRAMPMEKVSAGIAEAALRLSPAGGDAAARAVLTTDSGPKQAFREVRAAGRAFRIVGFAKGAGMIHPNMATMLAFLATDAPVAAAELRVALRHAVDRSFNQISVDGDESTNDMAVLLANGAEGGDPIVPGEAAWTLFQDALTSACTELAKRIAADGEGATRLLEVRVEGAADDGEARAAARAVARSNLVKSAVHGHDPNWGRVLAAIGSARVAVRHDAVGLWVGAHGDEACVLRDGEPLGADALQAAARLLESPEVTVRVALGAGSGAGVAWGCDLTEDYVRFNAAYST